ncbi:MAG TPA: hypothetical protein VGI74_03335 [Streptosporangiaceae bacterium]
MATANGDQATRGRSGVSTAVTTYLMNPAEDVIVFGDELADEMWVLADDCCSRPPYGGTEDERLHSQRFRRVTRLRREGDLVTFIGEWLDGYQAMHQASTSSGWIVKKDSLQASRGLTATPHRPPQHSRQRH